MTAGTKVCRSGKHQYEASRKQCPECMKEAGRRYRSRIKADPEKYEARQAKKREQVRAESGRLRRSVMRKPKLIRQPHCVPSPGETQWLMNYKGATYSFLVDDVDNERVVAMAPWHLQRHSAVVHSVSSREKMSLHRYLLGLERGDPREGDHINGDILDNRRSNLRIVSDAENAQNCRVNRDSTSGYLGVNAHGSKWMARVRVDDKERYLGRYNTIEEAAQIAHKARLEHYPGYVPERHGFAADSSATQ